MTEVVPHGDATIATSKDAKGHPLIVRAQANHQVSRVFLRRASVPLIGRLRGDIVALLMVGADQVLAHDKGQAPQ